MSTHLILQPSTWIAKNSISDKKQLENEEKLLAKLAQVALKDLREDEHTRKECLQHLKEWIRQHPDIENCLTDDKFLLRFLRVKKFSIPMAEQTLLKYMNFRKRFKHLTYDLDYLDEKVYAIISNGYIFASPFRDANGRRVIVYNLSKFDPHKYNSTDMSRAHAITYETIVDDEETQIMGINHVADVAGVTASYITLWSITEFATLIRWGEQSFPMRHKEINLINLPTGIKYVYDFAQNNIRSKKLKERFTIHNSLTDLHKIVDKNCLPLEMGGVMRMHDMVQLWKEELAAKRDRLLSYDAMNLLSDRGIIRRRDTPVQDNTGIGGLSGSFRKLEVD